VKKKHRRSRKPWPKKQMVVNQLTQSEDIYFHRAVMVKEALEFLNTANGGIFVDGTCGEGGHTEAILLSSPNAQTVSFDLDEKMLKIAKTRLSQYANRTNFVHNNFNEIDKALKNLGILDISGILLDLGISMAHLKSEQRGISFNGDQPLDMRLNQSSGIPLSDILKTMNQTELEQILNEFGEERQSKKIARAIVEFNKNHTIKTTGQLTEIILSVLPRFGRIHPATKTFQALRIYTNSELDNLRTALPKCLDILKSGSTLVVISYHSLEDRIVKQAFKEADKEQFTLLTKKVVIPTYDEVASNPSARSAKMRAIRRDNA